MHIRYSRRVLALCATILSSPVIGNEPSTPTTSAPSATATVRDTAIEEKGGELFFRTSVAWPSQDIPADFTSFADKAGHHRRWYREYIWPEEAVALIPQTPEAFGVFINQAGRETLIRGPVFLGKLRKLAKQDFLLRCPTPSGQWQYLPVSIDFSSAPRKEGVAGQWARAELAFVSQYSASPDQSFFAYARELLQGRQSPSALQATQESDWQFRSSGRDRLYDITTGALAIQESLQLDRMRNAGRDEGLRVVPIDTIQGVAVESHPWTEMIGDRSPAIEPLAALVPADQYYVRFRTTKAMRNFLQFAESWGGSVLSEMEVSGRDYGVREKIETQICLKSTWLSELLGPAVIDSLAITGADPYLREGSDFTMVFRLKAPPVFEAAVGRFLDQARKAHSDLQEGTEQYEGVSIQWMRTPDSTVRCYRVRLDEYCVYSNSPAGIRRVIDTHAGRVPSLAKSLDFVYMRTLYPVDSPQEDGFVFLSDPFIRALVGPRVRILEKRRLETLTSLEMIKNAAMLYLWEHPGAAIPELQQLYDGGYLDARRVAAEPGDKITWDPAMFAARSERYGRMGYLTPIAELPADKATEKEQVGYEQFRTRYQQYWRRYFDPIGIRVTAGQDISLSVTILPLINNSAYADLVENFGGRTTRLEPAYASGPRIIHFAAHLNPESHTLREIQSFMLSMAPANQRLDLGWIGQRMEFWIEDSDALLSMLRDEKIGEAFKVPVVVGVQVKNPLTLAGFLVGVQAMVRMSAPNLVIFEPTEPYKDAAFTAIRRSREEIREEDEWKDAALYYGVVGGYLYLSTSLESLHRIVDVVRDPKPQTQPAADHPEPPAEGHLAFSIIPANAKKAVAALDYYLARNAWTAEQEHLRNLWLVAHTVGLDRPDAPPPERVLGYKVESALGSSYRYDAAHDSVVSSVAGSRWDGRKSDALPETAPVTRLLRSIAELRATLAFTKDGLRTELTIRRNP